MRNFLLGLVFSGMVAGSAGAGLGVGLLIPGIAASAQPAPVDVEPVVVDAARARPDAARPRPDADAAPRGRADEKGKKAGKPGKQKKPTTPAPKPQPKPDPTPDADDDAPKAPPASGIVHLGDNRYQVPRPIIQRYVSDPDALSGQAGATQVASGWKLTSVKPGSKVAQMGFKQGDVITSVNGYGLDSLSKTWWAGAHLKNEDSYRVIIKRGGATQTLRYDVID